MAAGTLLALGLEEVTMPGDGNCFFNCIVHQQFGLPPGSSEFSLLVRQLRLEVVDFLREQIYEQECLLESLYLKALHKGVLFPSYDSLFLRKEAAALSYLELLEETEWADHECFAAVNSLKGINLKVVVYETGVVLDCGDGSDLPTIFLVYRQGNHYNSVQRKTVLDQSQVSLQSVPPQLIGGDFMEVDPLEHSAVDNVLEEITSINVGTWNVSGASKSDSRDVIDGVLLSHDIHILSLQESNSPSKFNLTSNYKWYMSPKTNITSKKRPNSYRNGVGILVRKLPGFSVLKTVRISERLIYCVVQTPVAIVRVIGVHIPPNIQESEPAYRALCDLLLKFSPKEIAELILLGDWNGHIGKDIHKDSMYIDLVGHCLHHNTTDSGGDHFLDFIYQFGLRVCTTFGRHSARITRRFKDSSSQLDHIVLSKTTSIFLRKIKGVETGITDHSLVLASVKNCIHGKANDDGCPRSIPPDSSHADIPSQPSTQKKKKNNQRCQRRWDVSTLSNPKIIQQFQKILNDRRGLYPTHIKWPDLVLLLHETCSKVLTRQDHSKDKSLTPRRRKALDSLKDTLSRRAKGSTTAADVAAKRVIVRREFDRALEQECLDFFSKLNDFHYLDRVKKTYKFIRNFRKKQSQPSKPTYIPLGEWCKVLQESEGPDVPMILETDHFPLLPPPTVHQVECIIRRMKRGKAPGVDGLSIELFKAFSGDMVHDLTKILENIWIYNEPPIEWQQTLQFPIAKVAKPSCPSDFRRITLTPVGYRIYAHFLLHYLDDLLEPLGDYQAAFLQNRSVDDHLFTLGRVLEEEWNAGNTLYVLSLDLEKAFDKVDLNVATIVLKGHKLPHHLVNRIIKACMWERTSLIWYRQLTPTVSKSQGVKQGCPLSPRLFTLLLDSVLQTMSEETSIPIQQPGPTFQFPIVLAYADDIILISPTTTSLITMLTSLVPLLESVGLRCNMNKSSMVIRDPLKILEPEDNISLGSFTFKVEENIKYLGSPFHSTLSRPDTIRKRCRIALGLSKTLSNFVRKYRLSRGLAVTIYNVVLFPMIAHGLKVKTFTRQNRKRLRRYEREILANMVRYAKCSQPPTSCRNLLHGKTITRRIKVMRICYWGHVHRRPPTHMLQLARSYRIRKRKVGRPSFTYINSMREAFSKYPLTSTEWNNLKADKIALKTRAEDIYSECLQDTSSSEELSCEDLEDDGSCNL